MACVIGKRCEEHSGSVHGQEAEELRAGLELLIRDGDVTESSVQRLLDHVDARDSLSFLEKRRPKKAAT
jgi:hypothetical protein